MTTDNWTHNAITQFEESVIKCLNGNSFWAAIPVIFCAGIP